LNKLSVYLDDEMENVEFAQTLQQLAQQVINIGKQEQNSATFNIDARDNARVNAIGKINADRVDFGDRYSGQQLVEVVLKGAIARKHHPEKWVNRA
jgi:hypothetical protein